MSDLPLYTSDIRQTVKIRMGPGQASIPPMRVFDAFDRVVQKYGNEEALFQKRPIEVSLNEDIEALDNESTSKALFFAGGSSRRNAVDELDMETVQRSGGCIWESLDLNRFRAFRYH